MEDLFRFVALRAPDDPDPDQSIDLTNRKSEYQAALEEIHRPSPSLPPSDLVKASLAPSASFGARARALAVAESVNALPEDGIIHHVPPLPTPAPPPPPNPVQLALRITLAYVEGSYGGGFIWDIAALPLAK